MKGSPLTVKGLASRPQEASPQRHDLCSFGQHSGLKSPGACGTALEEEGSLVHTKRVNAEAPQPPQRMRVILVVLPHAQLDADLRPAPHQVPGPGRKLCQQRGVRHGRFPQGGSARHAHEVLVARSPQDLHHNRWPEGVGGVREEERKACPVDVNLDDWEVRQQGLEGGCRVEVPARLLQHLAGELPDGVVVGEREAQALPGLQHGLQVVWRQLVLRHFDRDHSLEERPVILVEGTEPTRHLQVYA
mmetsp:Transcript_124891/g.347719  ORF Transcript_124891/g.347719 Transcript_124891/m.347719 type:complete len:246 (-) Transcript_124891:658-1395(-)